jgi:hypothetical protein
MNCTKVLYNGKVLGWASSMAEARQIKKEAVEAEPTIKPNSVQYETAEVPTNKADLLVFLNENKVGY